MVFLFPAGLQLCSSKMLWLTCCLVFPATVHNKNGSLQTKIMLPLRYNTAFLGGSSAAHLNTWGTKDKKQFS